MTYRGAVVVCLFAACGGPEETTAISLAVDQSCPVEPPALAMTPVVASADPGTLIGGLAVTADGAATYTIALAVPPGRAGMQPELALAYSSRAGNGLAGVGWSVTGGSQITPCGNGLRTDGEVRPVQLGALDRYCLDGARLVAVGADEYRTEPDGAARIVVTERDAIGPRAWAVYTRDGRIERFGSTACSRVEGVSTTLVTDTSSTVETRRLAWLRSRTEDRAGNYMTYAYDRGGSLDQESCTPASELEWRLHRIDYAGFAPTAAPPTRSVELEYATRADPLVGHVRGNTIRTTKRLRRITMAAPDAPEQALAYVRQYRLAYLDEVPGRPPADNPRSMLWQITQCDPAGTCLRPMTLTYSDPELVPQFTRVDAGAIALGDPSMLITTDTDGDGRDDLVYLDATGQVAVRRGTAGGLAPIAYSTFPARTSSDGELVELVPYDTTEDGRVDLLGTYEREFCCTGNGQQTTCQGDNPRMCAARKTRRFAATGALPEAFGSGALTTPFHTLADGDGDLRADSFELADRAWSLDHFELSDSDAWKALGRCDGAASCDRVRAEHAKLVDLDGDGVTDLLVPYVSHIQATTLGTFGYDLIQVRGTGANRRAEAFRTNLESEYTKTLETPGAYMPWAMNCSVFADVTGDGLVDQVSLVPGVGRRVNLGDNRFGPWEWSLVPGFAGLPGCSDNNDDAGVRVVDTNQDGRSDLLILGKTTTGTESARVLEATATGFISRTLAIELAGHPGDARLARTLDVNGDGLVDVLQLRGTTVELYLQSGGHVGRLVRILDGNSALAAGVTYAPLTATGYVPDTDCAYPERCLRASAMLVVTAETAADPTSSATAPTTGATSQLVRTYAYHGARADAKGQGWLGFGSQTVTDARSGATTTTTFDRRRLVVGDPADAIERYPFLGRPVDTVSSVPVGGVTLITRSHADHATRAWKLGGVPLYFAHASSTVIDELESATLLRTTTTTTTVDDYQNATRVEVVRGKASDLARTITTRTITNDPTSWLLGLVTREQVTSEQGGTSATRTTGYAHEPDGTGRVRDVIREPDGVADVTRCTRIATRDAFGQPARVEVTPGATCAPGVTTRAVTSCRDGDGTFVTATVDALGTTRQRIHPGFGIAYAATDADDRTTTTQFDGFGRARTTTRPDGTWTATAYATCGTQTCATTTASDGGYQRAESDVLGRTVRVVTHGFDGRDVRVDSSYDNRGRVVATTRPYFVGDASVTTTFAYDNASRAVKACQGTSAVCKRTFYNGLDTDFDDETGIRRTERASAAGPIASSSIYPPSGVATTTYMHGPFATLVRVTDAAANAVTLRYDAIGRRIETIDEDLGLQKTRYDEFDQPIEETIGTGISTYTYDGLGRLVARSAPADPDGDATWIYDPPGHKGKLAATANANFTNQHQYDALGRLASTVVIYGGAAHYRTYEYDAQSRVARIWYPAAAGRGPVITDHRYNAHGYLERIVDPTSGAGGGWTIWQATHRDASGQITRELANAGSVETLQTYDPIHGRTRTSKVHAGTLQHDATYTYLANGNLGTRRDERQGLTETFAYDTANRLKSSAIPSTTTRTWSYDALGNLTATNESGLAGCTWSYGTGAAGPHALTRIQCGSTNHTFAYDNRGNLTAMPAIGTTLASRALTYGPHRKPVTVARGTTTFNLHYDADGHRVVKVPAQGSGTRVDSIGREFEKRTAPDGTVTSVYQVYAGDRAVYQYSWSKPVTGAGTHDHRFLHADSLGSVATTTNAAGTGTADKLSYDAWGKRRSATWTSTTTPAPPALTKLGFTGHSHDDDLGLIDMKGRVYDPVLKRFTSPDTLVQAPHYGPSWNRYSYVFNNPLNFTDPSGHAATGMTGTHAFGSGFFSNLLYITGSSSIVRFFVTGDGRFTLSNPEPIFAPNRRDAPKPQPLAAILADLARQMGQSTEPTITTKAASVASIPAVASQGNFEVFVALVTSRFGGRVLLVTDSRSELNSDILVAQDAIITAGTVGVYMHGARSHLGAFSVEDVSRYLDQAGIEKTAPILMLSCFTGGVSERALKFSGFGTIRFDVKNPAQALSDLRGVPVAGVDSLAALTRSNSAPITMPFACGSLACTERTPFTKRARWFTPDSWDWNLSFSR